MQPVASQYPLFRSLAHHAGTPRLLSYFLTRCLLPIPFVGLPAPLARWRLNLGWAYRPFRRFLSFSLPGGHLSLFCFPYPPPPSNFYRASPLPSRSTSRGRTPSLSQDYILTTPGDPLYRPFLLRKGILPLSLIQYKLLPIYFCCNTGPGGGRKNVQQVDLEGEGSDTVTAFFFLSSQVWGLFGAGTGSEVCSKTRGSSRHRSTTFFPANLATIRSAFGRQSLPAGPLFNTFCCTRSLFFPTVV